MGRERIYQYFQKRYNSYDTSLIPNEIPDEMIEDGKWLLKKSTLDSILFEEFLKENNILAPTEYIEYMLTAAHCFSRLDGKLDNFLFEDDVDVEIEVIPQPIGRELEYVKAVILEEYILVKNNYLPLAIFDEDGYLCMDVESKQIGWLPHEYCIGLTTREELENEYIPVFESIDDYIKCFLGGERYEVPDYLAHS